MWGVDLSTWFISLMMRILRKRHEKTGHEMRTFSWLADSLLTSERGLFSLELVNYYRERLLEFKRSNWENYLPVCPSWFIQTFVCTEVFSSVHTQGTPYCTDTRTMGLESTQNHSQRSPVDWWRGEKRPVLFQLCWILGTHTFTFTPLYIYP